MFPFLHVWSSRYFLRIILHKKVHPFFLLLSREISMEKKFIWSSIWIFLNTPTTKPLPTHKKMKQTTTNLCLFMYTMSFASNLPHDRPHLVAEKKKFFFVRQLYLNPFFRGRGSSSHKNVTKTILKYIFALNPLFHLKNLCWFFLW